MAQAKGSKSRLVMDFETTFGSDPASPAGLVMPINSFTLKSSRPKNTRATITGTRNPVKPFDGNVTDSGDVVVPVDSTAFPYWLKAMFGAPTTTGSGPTYEHVFKVGDSMPSEVMEMRYSDGSTVLTYAKHNGVKISSLALSIGGDQELVATMNLEAKGEALSGTPYDASPTALTLDPWCNYQAALTEGGSAISIATALDINVDFGLQTDNYVIDGTGSRYSIPEGLCQVTGSVTTLFESTALLTKAINSTETSLVVTLTSGTNVLEIAINELQLERSTPGVEGPQGILLNLPFVAYMDDHAAASVIVATLTNGESSYA